MQKLYDNMRWLCEDARMLSSISVSYGTPDRFESARCGYARQYTLTDGGFIPDEMPVTQQSVYDLASLTKLFTAVLTMVLVEQGKLSLDSCAGRIDPRFVNLREVTVFDILSFRACLKTPGRIDDAPSREEGLERLFAVELAPLPDVRIYSDINAMVMKYVLEAASGMSFFDAVKTLILEPAGMRSTFAHVPQELRNLCVCYNYEHRISGDTYILRSNTPPGAPHDPKAFLLSPDGQDLCGHAGLFSTEADMIRFAQALLSGEIISRASLLEIGTDRTGRDNGDGTYRQFLGFQCFCKHPLQRLSEVPPWMSGRSIGLSGFTGNHLSLDPLLNRFVLFLGNRCHMRVSHILPPKGESLTRYGIAEDGTGIILWSDKRQVPSSAKYVYFKDERLHAPIYARMQQLGWL